ncbi:O-antigen ligase family protein [Thalassolituus oleivorans]|jgi:O-antigen ligase|uniref:O-antigen ligase family protein n=1 Tax=Thalassolituus oleivorans TaxID=187493 RepID=UPI001CE2E411|nr:O-antigen ligase family protein [Thalassolituus oleivorans]
MPDSISGIEEGYKIMRAFFTENIERIYSSFMLTLLCIVFLLNHSNQNSSQSMATLLLLLSPLMIIRKPSSNSLPFGLRYFIASSLALFAYSLMIFFHHAPSEIAWTSMRGLSFYLLAPVAVYILWYKPPSMQFIFWLTFSATLFSLYPVIKEYFGHGARGATSAHPIFWGNVCLTTGVVIFILSRDKQLKLRGKNLIGLIGLAMGLTASFWSQTRGGWLSIPIVLIALALFRVVKVRELLIASIILVVIFSTSEMLQKRLLATIETSNSGFHLDTSTQRRIDMWNVSIQAFEENYALGNGLDGFSRKIKELREKNEVKFYFEHAHNEVMEVLASRGIIGLVLLISLISGLLLTYWRHRKSTYAIAGLISTGQFLIYSTSEVFFSTKFTITYFLILQSLLLIACYKVNSHKSVHNEIS